MLAQINVLQATVAQSTSKLLRGSGSSAVSLAVWRTFDSFIAMANTPVWMTYRAIGSGGEGLERLECVNIFLNLVHQMQMQNEQSLQLS